MGHPEGQKKIMVVDDEPELTMLCGLVLEYHGFKVDTFTDPQEALSNYKPGYYDLVILDIMMPKMDLRYTINIEKQFKHSCSFISYKLLLHFANMRVRMSGSLNLVMFS
jgi:CheY-like chemotaxis protein